MKHSDLWNAVDTFTSMARDRALAYQVAEDECLGGRIIRLAGRDLVHFGSCSYLGLEVDPRLKEGAIEATRRYGTLFASSRAFVSAPLYGELEALLGEIFGVPALTAPTTTLAHLAAIPVLISEDDAILVDQHAHSSAQMAIDHVRIHGAHVELLRHGRLDLLADKLAELSRAHPRVWYVLDGVSSMQGDLAPVDSLVGLLERFDKLHLYFDDAHGMSWYGLHGRGWVLGRSPPHPRAVVVTTLGKAFAAGGAALIIADPEMRRRVAMLGPTMLFSGPIHPPALGAAIAAAKIHLSDEVVARQRALRERIELFNQRMKEREVPLMAQEQVVPIRFVPIGPPKGALDATERLKHEGFFINPAVFPAVPERRSGIRLTLTLHLSPDDIEKAVEALARLVPQVLREQGYPIEKTRKLFALRGNPWQGLSSKAPELSFAHKRSIEELDRDTWDRLLGAAGSFTWNGLRALEAVFRNNAEPEDNWHFHYFIVRAKEGCPVLATFFTEALSKDDMLAPEAVSRRIEERRQEHRYFLTSRVLFLGSLATEGFPLYLDRQGPWREALLCLLDAVGEIQARGSSTSLVLQCVPRDAELESFIAEQGFARFPMLDNMIVELDSASDEQWLESLGFKERWHQRKHVLPFDEAYDVEVLRRGTRIPSAGELERMHELYYNVWKRNLAINTFELPRGWLPRVLSHDDWEILLLTLKPGLGLEETRPVGMAVSLLGPDHYSFLLAGVDYRFIRTHGTYRQLLRQVHRRARQLGVRRLHLGFGAEGEKRGFGAIGTPSSAYVFNGDHYPSAVLMQMMDEVQRP